ncbi:MAG: radical SAM protein [Planctomycetales bacterium]
MIPKKNTNSRDVVTARGPKNVVDPRVPYAFLVEPERSAAGTVDDVATIFLTNKECPFHCLYCDLWKNTTDERLPVGVIPAQIDYALERLCLAQAVKLYNSGNFFDAQAIPPEDYPAIARRVARFRTVIVENHPNLCGSACVEFRDLLAAVGAGGPRRTGQSASRSLEMLAPPSPALPPRGGEGESHAIAAQGVDDRGSSFSSVAAPLSATAQLEVALGLETVHPDILPRLNKRMTLDDFRHAAEFLRSNDIAVRAFILLKPPFIRDDECVDWAVKSLEFAFDCGARVCSVIPTRGGNGIMEQLQAAGQFAPPRLESLEAVLEAGLRMGRGRVFVDLWDVERFCECSLCGPARAARLRTMNLNQTILPRVVCCCSTNVS